MIQCDFCNKWFHIECLKFNKSSLNKIKQFECPGCSLIRNSGYQKSVETHKSERTPLEEFKNLVTQVIELGLHIKLGDNHKDILNYSNRYNEIFKETERLSRVLDNYIEKSQEINFTSEIVKAQVSVHVNTLKDYLNQMLGMPFYCSSIEKISLVLRKFNLIDRVYHMKDKKRVDLPDLYFIDSMKIGQVLKSEFLQKNVSHCEDVLENLARIEELDTKKLAFPEYKKILDKLLKNVKYTNLIDKKVKLVDTWPNLVESTRTKLSNPRVLTLRVYKEDLAFFEKLPFVNEFTDIIRLRIKIIDEWRLEVRKIQIGTADIKDIQRLANIVQAILSPSDPELTWLNAMLQTNPLNQS
jgi:hypothetical protein